MKDREYSKEEVDEMRFKLAKDDCKDWTDEEKFSISFWGLTGFAEMSDDNIIILYKEFEEASIWNGP